MIMKSARTELNETQLSLEYNSKEVVVATEVEEEVVEIYSYYQFFAVSVHQSLSISYALPA